MSNTVEPFPIALVVSEFNQAVTTELQQGAMDRLREYGFPNELIMVISVPGAVEIPIAAQALANRNHFRAIVVLGAVIRGETSHYDYVCEQVSNGCSRVALDYQLPVIFGILTTENLAQAQARLGGAKGHKGKEAIDAAVQMVQTLEYIKELSLQQFIYKTL